jgi:hypothetical protein
MSETLPKREPELAEVLADRELEKEEAPREEPPNWRLSKFDMAREPEIAEPEEREEFIAVELLAPPDMLLDAEFIAVEPAAGPAVEPCGALEVAPPRAPPNEFQLGDAE